MRSALIFLMVALFPLGGGPAPAGAQQDHFQLTDLSLEQLMQLEVTLAGRKEQTLLEAPAAIYVITQDDLHRAGVTSLPEALRLVPGMQVARSGASVWAITARGLNDRFADKLLVLIDGRSVYTPLFSGVFWDVQDTLIEDIDRIEVIRGPGAALWGANAVNGVINIVTKPAAATPGVLAIGSGGSEERGLGALRYGGALGETASYRAWIKYLAHDAFVARDGADAGDDWEMLRGGFRLDWRPRAGDDVTLQGDLYGGEVGETVLRPALAPPFATRVETRNDVAGGNLLGRWTRAFSPTSRAALQLYYDRTTREIFFAREDRDTVDLDFQHTFAWPARHEITWGLGYRFTRDDFAGGPIVTLDPASRGDHLASGFAQDELALLDRRLRLIAGVRLEHNDYSGVEVQPTGRVLWAPHERHALWAAVSRAVQTPSRAVHDGRVALGVAPAEDGSPVVPTILGTRSLRAQTVVAYEAGYRLRPWGRVLLDVAAFFNDYDDLLTLVPGDPFTEIGPPARTVVPLRLANGGSGEARGVEIAGSWTPTDWWRLSASYTRLDLRLSRSLAAFEASNPRNQAQLHSSWNLPWRLELDALLFYVDNLPGQGVPSYLRLDGRLAWHATDRLELAVAGQNLNARRHRELGPAFPFLLPEEVERNVYGRITLRF
jgi:iron complex outermembrane receptor protein